MKGKHESFSFYQKYDQFAHSIGMACSYMSQFWPVASFITSNRKTLVIFSIAIHKNPSKQCNRNATVDSA